MRLIAIGLDGQDAELVADRCWQAGAVGLWEVDAATLRAGVDDVDAATFVTSLADLGPVDVTEREAVELAGQWSVVSIAGRDLDLWVPPTVFGDGHHPTTSACLDLLPSVVGPGATVLDVGCGAGALSIAAAVLGGVVTAIDLDAEALAATDDNASRNDVAVTTSSARLAEVAGPFDAVVANMTTGSLGPLVPDLRRCTTADGARVLSGMLEDQWPPVCEAMGGSVRDVRVVDGWVTAVVDGAGKARPG